MKVLVGKKHPLAREPFDGPASRPAGTRLETEAHPESDLLQRALDTQADAIVVDAGMTGAPGPVAWSDETSRSRTLVLCLHPDLEESAPEGILATACAYFLPTAAIEAVERVVVEVHGQACCGLAPRAPALALVAAPPREELSARDKQLLALLAMEKTSKEIAALLGLSSRTVDYHRQGLIKKLGVHGTVGLACYAVGAGLVRP